MCVCVRACQVWAQVLPSSNAFAVYYDLYGVTTDFLQCAFFGCLTSSAVAVFAQGFLRFLPDLFQAIQLLYLTVAHSAARGGVCAAVQHCTDVLWRGGWGGRVQRLAVGWHSGYLFLLRLARRDNVAGSIL